MIKRRRFYEQESVGSERECLRIIKRLKDHSNPNVYVACGFGDRTLVLDSGEFIEIFTIFDDDKCGYLQYEPYSCKVITNHKNLSFDEICDILKEVEGDLLS